MEENSNKNGEPYEGRERSKTVNSPQSPLMMQLTRSVTRRRSVSEQVVTSTGAAADESEGQRNLDQELKRARCSLTPVATHEHRQFLNSLMKRQSQLFGQLPETDKGPEQSQPSSYDQITREIAANEECESSPVTVGENAGSQILHEGGVGMRTGETPDTVPELTQSIPKAKEAAAHLPSSNHVLSAGSAPEEPHVGSNSHELESSNADENCEHLKVPSQNVQRQEPSRARIKSDMLETPKAALQGCSTCPSSPKRLPREEHSRRRFNSDSQTCHDLEAKSSKHKTPKIESPISRSPRTGSEYSRANPNMTVSQIATLFRSLSCKVVEDGDGCGLG